MLNSRIAAALLAAGVAIIGGGHVSQPAIVPVTAPSKKQRKGIFNGRAYPVASYHGTKGAGITVAAQKRASRKAKNVARNRAAHR